MQLKIKSQKSYKKTKNPEQIEMLSSESADGMNSSTDEVVLFFPPSPPRCTTEYYTHTVA